jgi:hypothetical protein
MPNVRVHRAYPDAKLIRNFFGAITAGQKMRRLTHRELDVRGRHRRWFAKGRHDHACDLARHRRTTVMHLANRIKDFRGRNVIDK